MTNLQAPAAPAPTPLPDHLTAFFGRQDEIATIVRVLDSGKQRLITLTGPGGTGKSRIALEVARRQRQRFEEMQDEDETNSVPRVYFVSLLEAVSAELFVAELRSAFGVREDQNPGLKPLASLVHALKGKQTLLVLDNFEQIAESGSVLLEELLQQVPGLTCLVTSRIRLPIPGEREIPVAPLPTLSPSVFATSTGHGGASVSNEAEIPRLLDEYPSLALFVDRAQLARTDFQMNRRNAASIIELVDRLEGIPLAIELAAARTHLMMPRQMLDRMGKRLDLLVNHRKVTGGRHQSLRETLQFSYELLPSDLQRFFTNLALFRGGFTAEAAEAITESPIALDLIAQLCDASFLRSTESSNGEIRFQMLETIREFAHEKQQESDPNRQQRHQAEKRHLAYFARLAEETDRSILEGKSQSENLDTLEAEHDNIRAALRRVLRAAPDAFMADESLRLIASMHNFWFMRSHFTEGREWDRQFWKRLQDTKKDSKEAGTLDPLLLSRAMNGCGVLAMYQGDYSDADHCYRYSLRLRRKTGDQSGIGAILNNAGLSSSRQRNWDRARSYFEKSFEAWRAAGDSTFIGRLTGNLGIVAAEQGDYAAAKKYFEDNLELARNAGETRGISMGLSNLGRTYYKIGDLEKAEALLTESLNVAQELKDYALAGAVLLCFGLVRSARAAQLGTTQKWIQAEMETGPQFLRVALEVYQELNLTIPAYAIADMERYPAATYKANGFPYTGLHALRDILERWLPEHAL
jgi:predicted ATPase